MTQTCAQGGICVLDRPNQAHCKCPTGLVGSNCSLLVNRCTADSCHHGKCLERFNDIFCHCDEGYYGPRCENTIDPCDYVYQPCGEHGKCEMLTPGYEGTFNCSCRFPWRGNRCEKLDGCVQNKCHEHSRCVNVPSEKGYECICAKGFFGPLCDDPVHYCKYNLCLNNGVCVEDGHEGYRCDCKLGYEGKACQDRVDPCRNSTCYHGGTCVPNVKSGRTYVCECADGFSGQSCEQKTEPCALQSDYCQNGGSCKSVGSMAFCDCPNAYYGPRCEKEKTRDYNMYFTGDNTTQRIISPNFPSSFLKEFTICAWVRYETETTLDDNRIIEAPPFLILGPFNGSEVTSDLITMDNIGATVDRSRLNYTIKENEWHHVCLRSPSAANDKWNVLVDGLIKSTLVHPRVTPTPQRVLILLGGSRDGKKKFVGEISFVQFYHRSLEDIEVSNMAYYCSKWMDFRKGLTIDWSQFSTVERNNKAVLSLYPGICTTSQCLPGRVDCSKIRDSIPPTVIGCPKDIHIISPRRLTEVHWEPNKLADMFTDNVFITDFTYNYGSGDTFSWGIHRVVYIARDSAGNMAECHFDVTVSPNACEKPGRPLNGTVNYESPGSNPSELVAFVKCGNGSMYADEVPAFYTCDSMGRWNRHGFQDSRWSFPDCAEYTSPSQTITGFTLSLGSCLNGSTDSTSKLAQAIDEASKNFGGFCENNDCVGSHQLQTSVLCSANSGSRSKRAVEGNLIRVNFTLFVNNTRKDVRAYIENTVSEVYQNETYEVDAPIFLCSESDFPLLFASQNLYSCVECVAGTYWNGHQCIPCPPDTYQSKTGQRQCIHCPNKTTTGYYKGAKSLGDCYTICDAGDFFNFTTNNCERCDRGSYSSSPGQRICTPCPEGHTTTKWGSTNASDCSSTCEAGKFMKPNGSCAKCARGTYKTEESMRCTPCKLNGLTTASTGSASPNDCNVIDCPFGHYVAKDAHSPVPPGASLSKICLPCPLGTYQEMMNRTDCTKCPAGMTTVTEGSTSPDQCGQPGGCSPSDLHQCAENHSCRYQKDRGYVCMADSIVTMVPETSVAWYVWLIIGLAGAFLACVLLGSFAFLRFKYPNLFSCCESPQLKQMTTTSFYRNNAVTISEPSLSPGDLPSAMPQTEFPVVLQEEVKLEPSTNHTVQSADLDIAPMSDVFNEIYTGLHKLAESGVDETSYRPPSPSLPPTPPSPTYPRPRLTVETKRNRRNRFEFSVQHHDVNTSREMTFDSDDLPSAHRIRFNSSSFRYSVDKVAPFDFETQFPSMSEGRFASQFPSTAGAFDFGFGSGHLEQFEHKRDQASSAIASSFSTMQAHDPVDDDDDDYFG
ncbi:hypothetical protein L596_005081 [Steinernema carpocapsae]|nr:hypothetical protein L596_005081 [Steinernema carpocapsae]